MSDEEISFVRKPAKHGKEDYVFTIPRNLIRMDIIDPNHKYKVSLKRFFDEKAHILRIINGLDEKLAFGQIDQETYYKLIKKYEEKLI